MSLLEQLYDAGMIDDEQRQEWSEDWSEAGFNIRHYGDVESMEKILLDLEDAGLGSYAVDMYEQFAEAIDHYIARVLEETGKNVDFNPVSQRWYDTDNGQFVVDPYTWIRD